MIHLFSAPRLRPARLLAATLAALLVLLAAACGSDTTRKASPVEDKVGVSGEFGKRPTVTIATPLKVTATKSWTQLKGSGATVGPQGTAILQLTMTNARTGKAVISTTDPGQHPLEASLTDQLFPSLLKAVSGASAGSRLVIASTAKDSYGPQGNARLGLKARDPVVMVADVLSTDPTTLQPRRTGANALPQVSPGKSSSQVPVVREGHDGPTGFVSYGTHKPTKVQTYTLRAGTGPALTGPHRMTADYLGVVWGKKVPFDTSYPKEPGQYTVGAVSGNQSVIPCWDKGLAGVKEGARVVLVCPPSTAYGAHAQPDIPANSTLVFLIDVLGVG